MKRIGLITKEQFESLKKLGYKELLFAVPTVDEAIDWIRRVFHIVIYNKAAPFVDPKTNSFISYGFSVKYCAIKKGWNFRESLGETRWTRNIYAAKRDAINIAIQHATKLRNRKAQVIKLRRAVATGHGKSLTKKLEK